MNDPSLPGGQQDIQPPCVGLHGEARQVQPVSGNVARRPPSTFRYAARDWREVGRLRWEVTSASQRGHKYVCDAEEGTCDCWDFKTNPGQPCYHIKCLMAFLAKWRRDNPDPTDA